MRNTVELDDYGCKELIYAIMIQAAKDYLKQGASDKMKAAIIKDLCSDYWDTLTDGLSICLAEQLVKNPKAVKERFRKEYKEDFDEETPEPKLVDYDDLLMEMQEQM